MFATVIAITKDLPDVEGDRAHSIDTLASRLGVRTIARLVRAPLPQPPRRRGFADAASRRPRRRWACCSPATRLRWR